MPATRGGHGPSNITLGRILDSQSQQSSATVPPQWVRDKIADQSITGGYKISKASRCCNVARAINGACSMGCDE